MKICGLHRWIVSSRDGKTWPAMTNNHLEDCADCRNWWQQQRSLEALLSEGAGEMAVTPGFTNRVMNKIERGAELSPTAPSYWWKIAAAGTCGLASVILISLNGRQGEPLPAGESSREFAEVRSILHKNSAVLQGLPEKFDDPLEKELAFMISDTRNAITFVADSVVPDDFRKAR